MINSKSIRHHFLILLPIQRVRVVRWYTNRFKLELSLADKYYVNNSGFHIHNYQYNSNDGSQCNNEPVEDVIHSANRKMDGIRRIIYHNIITDYNNIIIRIWINWYFLSTALRLLVTVQAFSNFFFKFQTFEILDTSLEIPSISIFKVWKT